MDGLFHGKSENKMDDLGVPPFRKSPYTLDVAEMKIPTDQIGYRPWVMGLTFAGATQHTWSVYTW